MAKKAGSRKKTGSNAAASTKQSSSSDASVPETRPVKDLASLHVWQIQAVRDVLLVGAIICLFWAGYALRAVTVPLLIALLLAYLFEPLVRWMVEHPKLRFSRVKAVSVILGAGGVLVLVALALFLPLIVGQTLDFVSSIRDGRLRMQVARIERFVPEEFHDEIEAVVAILPGVDPPPPTDDPYAATPEDDSDQARSADADGDAPAAENADGDGNAGDPNASSSNTPPVEVVATGAEANGQPPDSPSGGDAELDRKLADLHDTMVALMDERDARLQEQMQAAQPAEEDGADIMSVVRRGFGAVFNVVGSIIGFGLVAFLIPFYFFFFSLWYPNTINFFHQLIPAKNKDRTLELIGKMDHVVSGFVRGRIVISLIMGVMLAIGWLICGVPYALVIGLLVGIFCAVPYLGGIGIPLAVGLLFFEQLGLPVDERSVALGWIGVVLWPTLVFAIVQVVEGYVLTPMIAGKATNLDPVTILVAVLAGGSVMGIYGMLLAIPATACGKILITDVLWPRIQDWTEGRADDPLPIERD
jgi:predicted PurR-regulated permease PerM